MAVEKDEKKGVPKKLEGMFTNFCSDLVAVANKCTAQIKSADMVSSSRRNSLLRNLHAKYRRRRCSKKLWKLV